MVYTGGSVHIHLYTIVYYVDYIRFSHIIHIYTMVYQCIWINNPNVILMYIWLVFHICAVLVSCHFKIGIIIKKKWCRFTYIEASDLNFTSKYIQTGLRPNLYHHGISSNASVTPEGQVFVPSMFFMQRNLCTNMFITGVLKKVFHVVSHKDDAILDYRFCKTK